MDQKLYWKEKFLNYKDLVKEGKLKEEPKIRFDHIERLIRRSKKDLVTAKKLIDIDEGVALTIIYDAMFHSASALIRSQGYRPGYKSQHMGVIEAVKRTLGAEFELLIIKFNKLRINRNKFEYQAVFSMPKTQLLKALMDAKKFVSVIEKYVQEKNPQISFKFGD